MTDAKTIAVAYFLDWIAGDPEWLPHPVRLMGLSIKLAEPLLRWPGQTPLQEVIAGTVLTAATQSAAGDQTVSRAMPSVQFTLRVDHAISGVEPGRITGIDGQGQFRATEQQQLRAPLRQACPRRQQPLSIR